MDDSKNDEIIDRMCLDKDLSTDGSRMDRIGRVAANISKRMFGDVVIRIDIPKVLAFDLSIKETGKPDRFFSRSVNLCRDDSSLMGAGKISKEFWDSVLDLELSLDREDLAW